MRAFITSIFICFLSICSYAQSTAIAWSDIAHGNFGGTYAATISGNNFFAAEVISQTDSRTIRVKKYNSAGAFQTTAIYSDRCQTCSASSDTPLQIFPASDGGAFLYYEIADNSPVLKKIAPAGNVAWTIDNLRNLEFIRASPTGANGIYLTFKVTSGLNENNYFVYNVNFNSTINWTKNLLATLPKDLAATPDGGVVVTDNDSTKRFDNAGKVIWAIDRGSNIIRIIDSDFGYQADANRVVRFSLSTGNVDFMRNQQNINDLLVTSDKGVVFSTNNKIQKLSTSGNDVFINNNGSQRLTLAANGNIGSIGTTAPSRITVISPNGSLEWQKTLTYNLGENIKVYPSPDNGWIATTKGQVPARPSSYGTGFLYKFYPFSAGCGYSVNISPNTKQTICKTGTVAFEVTQPNLDLSFGLPSTDYFIQWVRDNQSVATNVLTYTGTQAGEYSARITQGNCVNNSTKVAIGLLGNTAPTLTSDLTELCLDGGANVTLISAGCSNNSGTLWSNNQTGTTINVSPNASTNYTAQCVDTYVENGVSKTCVSSPSNARRITILTTSNLNIPNGIISADAICQGTLEPLSVAVTGDISIPLTYLWTRNDASISSQLTFNASTAGSYQVTVKDKRGCSAQSGVKELKLLGNETPAVTTSISEICRGGGVQPVLSASGCTSTSYSWNNTSSATSSITVSPLNTTEYSVRCSDTFIAADNSTKTCLSTIPFKQTITVRQQSNIEIVDLFVPSVFCKNDGQAIVSTDSRNFISPANLEWFKDGVSISNALFINVSDPGDYQVKIRDARGCTAESAIKKVERSKLSLALTGNQQFCEGTNTNLRAIATDGIGASTFEWKLNNQAISTSDTINVTSTGNYIITATDAKGCQEVLEIPVTVFPKITADYRKSATVKGNLLYSFNSELLSGGKRPFDVTLTAASETNEPVSVSQSNVGKFNENSTISVKVKDANGCEFSDNIQIIYVPCDVAVKISGDTSFCYYNKVALQANQLSGIAPFTYS